MHAQATKVWLSFDNLQVSEERYLWQNHRSLSHGPRGSSDRQRWAIPKPRHEESPCQNEPEDVSIRGEALHPDKLSGSQSTNVWYVTVFDLKELRGESIWVEVCRQASVLSATLEPCSQTISLPHLTYFWGKQDMQWENSLHLILWNCTKRHAKHVHKNPSDNKMHTRKVHAEHHQSILIGWKRMQMQTKVCYISIMNVQLLTWFRQVRCAKKASENVSIQQFHNFCPYAN